MPRKKEEETPPAEKTEETPEDKTEEPEETPEPEEKTPKAPAKAPEKSPGPDPDLFASMGRGIAAGLRELGVGTGPEKSEGKTKEKSDDGNAGDSKPARK